MTAPTTSTDIIPIPFLRQASAWLYALNPSLSRIPPRADDPGTYCYMGPDGTTNGAILCQDMDYGMATCVGSWMLSPEHHIVEGILVTILALWVLRSTTPKLQEIMTGDTNAIAHLKVRHPPGAKAASLFCFGMIMCYKYFGYPKRVFYMVMPCNFQWVLSVVQCWVIPESWTIAQYTLLQLRLTFLMSVVIAIVTPETDDCLLPGEVAFYWFNHALLLLLPAAYVANGSVSCWPPATTTSSPTTTATKKKISTLTFNRYWWQYSCCLMAIFYFLPVTFLAIVSGLNLNFMMHPPHDHFLLYGPWFRLVAVASLATLFIVSRLLVAFYEQCLFLLVSRSNSSSGKKTTKQC